MNFPIIKPQMITAFFQAIKFVCVGVLNTAIDFAVYFALTQSFNLTSTTLKTSVKAFSYTTGILNSFYFNQRWTFRSQTGWATLMPFVLSNLVGLTLNAIVFYLSHDWLNVPETLALVVATGVTYLWNFSINKFVIFKK